MLPLPLSAPPEKKTAPVCETSVYKIKSPKHMGNLPTHQEDTSKVYCYVYCLRNEIALSTIYKTTQLKGSRRLQAGISSKIRKPHSKDFHNFNKHLHIYLYVNIFIEKLTRITWSQYTYKELVAIHGPGNHPGTFRVRYGRCGAMPTKCRGKRNPLFPSRDAGLCYTRTVIPVRHFYSLMMSK
jgi:hypothetical protein